VENNPPHLNPLPQGRGKGIGEGVKIPLTLILSLRGEEKELGKG